MEETLEDPIFGCLCWDEEMGWWDGQLELSPGHRLDVIIDCDEQRDSRRSLPSQARAWAARVCQREPEYRRWTAHQLVEARWNTHEPMTAVDIEGLLRLLSVLCAPDGSAQLYWDDRDVLFGGHGFYTQLNASGDCLEVSMP